jgi:hypothetical protein
MIFRFSLIAVSCSRGVLTNHLRPAPPLPALTLLIYKGQLLLEVLRQRLPADVWRF